MPQSNFLEPNDTFVPRHIGPTTADIQEMLAALSLPSLEALVEATVPSDIRLQGSLTVPSPRGELDVLAELRGLAEQNHVWRSLIGMGYYDCVTPLVIQRNILENPAWYTQYTPYQAEIAQGRLEALVNFQTMVADLTGLPLANASLLDEATAAAEAMTMCAAMSRAAGLERKKFFVSEKCHPQTIAVIQTRAEPLGIELHVGSITSFDLPKGEFFGTLLQYPATDGHIGDYTEFVARVHAAGGYVVVATDLLALTLLRPPGEFGADVAVGSSQRFGVPLGIWWAACRLSGHERRVPSADARANHRRVERCHGPAGLSPCAPDPGATYPTRKSHEQYLYGASTTRGNGWYVCRLSWSPGAAANCGTRSWTHVGAGRGAPPSWL